MNSTYSHTIYIFLEPSHKLSRILNSTMARIHLFMCSFLISSVLSTSNTSKYLSLELLIQLFTVLLNMIVILRRNLILFYYFSAFYFNSSTGHSQREFMFLMDITKSPNTKRVYFEFSMISSPEVTQ